jgi:lipid-A-disaccharide synthase-like uncharacterized protein
MVKVRLCLSGYGSCILIQTKFIHILFFSLEKKARPACPRIFLNESVVAVSKSHQRALSNRLINNVKSYLHNNN